MAQVSSRIGIGRATLPMLGVVVLNVTLAGVAWFAQVSWLLVALLLAGAVLGLVFAFVHSDRVIALDDDDDPATRVGDPAD